MSTAAGPPHPLSQDSAPYLEALERYVARDSLRLNVPGHVAAAVSPLERLFGMRTLEFDVPPLIKTIDGGPFPTPLEQSLALAAAHWGARRTWFLTNGASQAVVAAVVAARSLGPGLVLQRNAHSSTIDGMVVAGSAPSFVMPSVDWGLGAAHGVTPEALGLALAAAPGARAALVVSPSYFGAVADVRSLAVVADEADVLLVVDESWGSHFGLHPGLPEGALGQGADIVVSSTHKLGGSLTQSAMLHLGHGPRAVQVEAMLARAATMFESTSYSSLLLASLDVARQQLATRGYAVAEQALADVRALREAVAAVPGVRVADAAMLAHPDVVAVDPFRLVLDVRGTGLTGFDVATHLRTEHPIDVEMATFATIVAVLAPGRPMGTVSAELVAALSDLPAGVDTEREWPAMPAPGAARMTPREASFSPFETVSYDMAVGRVASTTVSAYPPGVPNVFPGELITADAIRFLAAVQAAGGQVRGGPAGRPGLQVVAGRRG